MRSRSPVWWCNEGAWVCHEGSIVSVESRLPLDSSKIAMMPPARHCIIGNEGHRMVCTFEPNVFTFGSNVNVSSVMKDTTTEGRKQCLLSQMRRSTNSQGVYRPRCLIEPTIQGDQSLDPRRIRRLKLCASMVQTAHRPLVILVKHWFESSCNPTQGRIVLCL